MVNEIQVLRDYLKKNGLKDTSQREEILNHLLAAEKHMAPEEIYETLRRKDPRLGRATVFRTLKMLEACGLATKVTFADGRHKFEACKGRAHHDHMICVECGAVIEFVNESIEKTQDKVARDHGFKILWHRHEIFGRCPDCEAGRRPARR
jgi:Fur family transcriptional regulator, ferric uptake regulator